jgi:hypothetical protein
METSNEVPGLVLAIVFLGAALYMGITIAGCMPKCVKGHYASWLVPTDYYDDGAPAHYEQRFVCDEYEKRKP